MLTYTVVCQLLACVCVYVYVWVCVCVYIYIYMDIGLLSLERALPAGCCPQHRESQHGLPGLTPETPRCLPKR